jgi:hypothetical protein
MFGRKKNDDDTVGFKDITITMPDGEQAQGSGSSGEGDQGADQNDDQGANQGAEQTEPNEATHTNQTTEDKPMVDELMVDGEMEAEVDKKIEAAVPQSGAPTLAAMGSDLPGFTEAKPDYGMFNGARVSGDADGKALVVVPMRRGRLTLELDAELAAADILDNFAGSIMAESKKHKP